MDIQKLKHKSDSNKILKIFYDECPESPREWDNLGTVYADHRDYNLMDKSASKEELMQASKNGVVLPIYMYEHSGIALSCSNATYPFNDQWDSCQVGYVYATKEKILEEYNIKKITDDIKETVERVLMHEIETYSRYLGGHVYGYAEYQIKKCDMNHDHEEIIDSCFGYYEIADIMTAKPQYTEIEN